MPPTFNPRPAKPLVELARQYHMLPVPLSSTCPKALPSANRQRPDRDFGAHRLRTGSNPAPQPPQPEYEGFRPYLCPGFGRTVDAATIARQPSGTILKTPWPCEHHRDVHAASTKNCCPARGAVIPSSRPTQGPRFSPRSRQAIFLGDPVDRGRRFRVLSCHEWCRLNALCCPAITTESWCAPQGASKVQLPTAWPKSWRSSRETPSRPPSRVLGWVISHYALDDGQAGGGARRDEKEMQGAARASP